MGRRAKQTPGAAAGELVNKSAPDASPCPEGTSGSRGRSCWEGEARRGWSGLAWVGVPPALGQEMRPAPRTLPSDLPRPEGGGGGGVGAVAVPTRGPGTGGGNPPVTRRPRRAQLAAPGWRPDLRGCRASPAAACSPPGAPPPRPRTAGVPRVHSVYVTMTRPTGGSRSERPRVPSALCMAKVKTWAVTQTMQAKSGFEDSVLR
ncbi:translation initiation factor IF-2-like [Panthera pardus]|uniref:Translation initiation factor IF-2-like n=1 Tax=Panthera pardus TaxID=9691 RepID=A0A9W2V2M3_PANPR|nr:translation initiation factor IF-2-like [Panthera pardus]